MVDWTMAGQIGAGLLGLWLLGMLLFPPRRAPRDPVGVFSRRPGEEENDG